MIAGKIMMSVHYSSSSNDLLGHCVLGFFFGIWAFFWGFKKLRRKRLIENIPTSTVRGLAMGLVELSGKAKKTCVLKGPFSEVDCVFYRFTIEKYVQSGKSSRWVIVAKGDSSACQFYLDDATGKVLVSAQDAEYFMPIDYEFKTGFGVSTPANLMNFAQKYNLVGIWGASTLRFREWHIQEDDDIYILGTAQKSDSFQKERNEKLVKRLEEIKNNPKAMQSLDVNKDGTVSQDEWDLAVVQIEQEIIQEELKQVQSMELADVVIAKSAINKILIISEESQKDLISKLKWQSALGVFGGAGLTIVTLVYILIRLKVIKF